MKQDKTSLIDKKVLQQAWRATSVLLSMDCENRKIEVSRILLRAFNDCLNAQRPEIKKLLRRERKRKRREPSVNAERTFAIFPEAIKLQHSIYSLTERVELEHENDFLKGKAGLNEKTLLIRYIKKVFHLTLNINLFDILTGITQTVYRYKKSSTEKCYSALVYTSITNPQPNNKVRSKRKEIIEKLRQRFSNFVARDEESQESRFVTRRDNQRILPVVEDYLSTIFIPFQTSHFQPLADDNYVLNELAYSDRTGRNPVNVKERYNKVKYIKEFMYVSDGDPIYSDIIHVIVCPQCFQNLTSKLDLPGIRGSLRLPAFFNLKNEDGGSDFEIEDGHEPTEEDLLSLTTSLLKQKNKREDVKARELVIRIDDGNPIYLDLLDSNKIEFIVRPEDDYIRVYTLTEEGELPISSLSLKFERVLDHNVWISSCVSEGGQLVRMIINPEKDEEGNLSLAHVKLEFKETKLKNKLSFLVAWLNRMFEKLGSRIAAGPVVPKIVFASLALFAASYFGYMFFFQKDQNSIEQKAHDEARGVPGVISPQQDDPSKPENGNNNNRPLFAENKGPNKGNNVTNNNEKKPNDSGSRWADEVSGSKEEDLSLARIKIITISISDRLSGLTSEELSKLETGVQNALSTRYTISSDRNVRADAQLTAEISSRRDQSSPGNTFSPGGKITARIHLNNRAGRQLIKPTYIRSEDLKTETFEAIGNALGVKILSLIDSKLE